MEKGYREGYGSNTGGATVAAVDGVRTCVKFLKIY